MADVRHANLQNLPSKSPTRTANKSDSLICKPKSKIWDMEPQPSPFILGLPKAELHLHLEGSVNPPTQLELRKRHGKHSTLTEVEQLYRYQDFPGFLLAFKSVSDDLQTGEDYELIAYRLMQ